MSSSHKISLHLSKNSSLDSLKESPELRPQEAQKSPENVLKTKESLKNIKQILDKTSEKYKVHKKDLSSPKQIPKSDPKK